MEEKDNPNKTPEIPSGIKQAMEEAQKASERFAEIFASVSPSLEAMKDVFKPTIDLEIFKTPHISVPIDPNVQRERNEWKRHTELLEKQAAILGVQTEVLNEQRGNTVLSVWVLRVSIAALVVAILSLGVAVYPLFSSLGKMSNSSNTQKI